MANKKLVTTGLITALLVSNLVVGYQYNKDSKEYEKKLSEQTQISTYRQKLINEKNSKIDVSLEVIKRKDETIHRLRQQLANAKNNSESPSVSVSRGSIENNYKSFYVEGTAYTSKCVGCSGYTFSEHNVKNTVYFGNYRIVATDLNVIPLYSLLKVETRDDVFYAIVLDKGGAIKGYKMDLLVKTYDDAIEFGRQKVKVTILREGKG
jgi:3D (Asp-Asp-Asp) domain-containing protein